MHERDRRIAETLNGARLLIERMQWLFEGPTGAPMCPSCCRLKADGHAPNCEIADHIGYLEEAGTLIREQAAWRGLISAARETAEAFKAATAELNAIDWPEIVEAWEEKDRAALKAAAEVPVPPAGWPGHPHNPDTQDRFLSNTLEST
ncbi:MAG: hypothetical protein V3R87_12945, partial [Dehalococcoidia bacterium]